MQAVVLAAGDCSRFWPLNTRHKSLIEVGGATLLERTLSSLAAAGVSEAVIVQGPDKVVENTITPPLAARFVEQTEPRGMGDALQQAQPLLDDTFFVTGPYRIDAATVLDQLQAAGDVAVAAARTETPERYGMLALEDGAATGIVEKPAAGEAPSTFKAVSTYLLDTGFFPLLDDVSGHYSFEAALDQYMSDRSVGVARLDREPPSLKYPWHVFDFAQQVLAGQESRIAESAQVAESATIEGDVVVAANAEIYENAVVRGPCYIGEDCVVGSHAVVRAHTSIGAGSTIGANAEIRGSVVQPEFSMHAGFVGDSVIGRNVAVGAGTVTANRRVRENGERQEIDVTVDGETVATGRDRLGAVIGDDVDIGTQANLMPGVCIGTGSFIGPSSLVRRNVADGKTFYTEMQERERDR